MHASNTKWLKQRGLMLFVLFALHLTVSGLSAQGISITKVQNLSFGAFSQGNAGGTITVSNSGERSATGAVIPLNLGIQYFQAAFDVEAPAGTIISISNGADATLRGSKGGSMPLQIGNSDVGSPFITTASGKTRVNIGGTLSVGSPSANPPDAYSGSFYITLTKSKLLPPNEPHLSIFKH